jgi:hypothetical protein
MPDVTAFQVIGETLCDTAPPCADCRADARLVLDALGRHGYEIMEILPMPRSSSRFTPGIESDRLP